MNVLGHTLHGRNVQDLMFSVRLGSYMVVSTTDSRIKEFLSGGPGPFVRKKL